MGYRETGVLTIDDLLQIPSEEQLEKGVALAECVENIPCNPCVDACPVDAISMEDINSPPIIDFDRCTGCAQCVAVCPGLAIFVIKTKEGKGWVTLPYEFLPVPSKDELVDVLNRKGERIGTGKVTRIRKQGTTWVITVEVDKDKVMEVRNIRCRV